MKLIFRCAIGFAIAVGASTAAFAQLATPPSFDDPYYAQVAPLGGAYYDPAQPGQGIAVDIGPDGTMFVGVFHHESDGSPSFHTMQGRFVPNFAYPDGTEQLRQRPDPGALGTLRSPLYLTVGGNCLDCPHRTSSSAVDHALGVAELTFTESRRATLSIGSRTLELQRLNIDRSDAGLLPGSWLFAVWEGSDAADALSTVEISPMEAAGVQYRLPCCNIGPEYPLPTAAALWYRVTCVERCDGFDTWRRYNADLTNEVLAEVVLWYEPATGKAVLDQFVRSVGGQRSEELLAVVSRRFFELSIDTNLVTGRASYRGAYTWINTNSVVPTEGTLLQMTRLPRGKQLCGATACP
jgi:hypothetical protein